MGRASRDSLLADEAPEKNPVERVFWRLHEAVTRNHRCRTIDTLVRQAVDWLEQEGAANPPLLAYGLRCIKQGKWMVPFILGRIALPWIRPEAVHFCFFSAPSI
jgi:hypothetical protein